MVETPVIGKVLSAELYVSLVAWPQLGGSVYTMEMHNLQASWAPPLTLFREPVFAHLPTHQ